MKRKNSARVEAAQKQVSPAEVLIHAAAERVGPLVQGAADRVGPLAHSAADRITPLAQTAADRVAPLAQSAVAGVGPLAASAAGRVGPLAQQAAERVAPLAQQAAGYVTPYAHQAADFVTPYAHQAVELVGPYATSAAGRVGPLAQSARERGAQAAHDAVEAVGPKLDEALSRVSPAVGAARDKALDKVNDDLLPKLGEALSAAAATPVVLEATKRGRATLAAARGELELPQAKKKRSWFKRLALIAALAGVAAVVARQLLGSKDADWQAARPAAPYAPSTPPTAPAPTNPAPADSSADVTATEPAAASDLPEESVLESSVDVPADELEAPAAGGSTVGEDPALVGVQIDADGAVTSLEGTDAVVDEVVPNAGGTDATDTSFDSASLDEARAESTEDQDEAAGNTETSSSGYSGEGVYVGSEPPEGYFIKGNERSMKYHTPESGGYSQTTAEVWFNSEEAALAAGFIRAQG